MITQIPISFEHLVNHGFVRIQCECGHELFVWPQNIDKRVRATCLKCRSGRYYTIDRGGKSCTVTDLKGDRL